MSKSNVGKQLKPPGKKPWLETPQSSGKRDRTPSTPESEFGAVAQATLGMHLTQGDITHLVESAMSAAMETARSKLAEDMNTLIQAKIQAVESSVETLSQQCDVRDERISGLEHDNSILSDEV